MTLPKHSLSAEEFWRFSLVVYQKPGVEQHCLFLQNEHQCNINLLLFACYLNNRECKFSNEILYNIIHKISSSEARLKDHRRKRIAAKACENNYTQLKREELELEKQQQMEIVNGFLSVIHNESDPQPPLTTVIEVFQLRTNAAISAVSALFEQAKGQIKKSAFAPPFWARNRHLQTIYPRFFQRRQPLDVSWETLKVADGDEVELAWGPEKSNPKGLVVMFHGLEGCIRSHYANDMMAKLGADNWQTVMMHFRGCSGKPNLTTRAYHSGDTADALYFLQKLTKQYSALPKFAIGVSLGGNMLLKLLAENPLSHGLLGAVAISAPLKLAECSASVSRGFAKVYQRYLLKNMKRNLLRKMQMLDYSKVLRLRLTEVNKLSTFREFDEQVTAPLHGFKNADDYYQKCSSFYKLKHIYCPTLVLHAEDDPFMDHSVIPSAEDLSPAMEYELSDKGGHVGFLQGLPWASSVWLHERVIDFLNEKIKQE